jgi:hypothetical protein
VCAASSIASFRAATFAIAENRLDRPVSKKRRVSVQRKLLITQLSYNG